MDRTPVPEKPKISSSTSMASGNTPPVVPNEIFALLVDAVEDYAIFALDPDGKILTWNSGGERLKGYRPDEVIGQNFSMFYTQEDLRRNHPQTELKIAKQSGKYEEEGWRIRRDGTRFWANIVITAIRNPDGSLRGYGKVTRDLTARRDAEIALRESEERFRLLVSNIVDYAIFMLDANGNVATWNLGAERNKGYAAHEIIGQHFSKFYGPQDLQAGKPAFELKEATAKGRYEEEGWRFRKDGSKFWANVIITAIFDSKHNLMGFSKVTRNLTERKIAEEKLMASYNALEERVEQRTRELSLAKIKAEKAVSARDQFFSMASHELKTPLSSLKMQAQLRKRFVLKGDFSDFTPENLPRLCDQDERQINRLTSLVDNMLDISRLTSGALDLNLEKVQLENILTGVLKVLEANLQESKNVCTVNCPSDLHGEWDPSRLEQVFTNLLSNAGKYAAGQPIDINAFEEDGTVKIEVQDRGPGIPKDKHHKLFDPFERLNAKEATGLGLGLYIVKQIVEAHLGAIVVESAPNQGTLFRICLPVEHKPLSGDC